MFRCREPATASTMVGRAVRTRKSCALNSVFVATNDLAAQLTILDIATPSMQGAIPDPKPGKLPHVLQPGEVWTGLIDQADLEAQRRWAPLLRRASLARARSL